MNKFFLELVSLLIHPNFFLDKKTFNMSNLNKPDPTDLILINDFMIGLVFMQMPYHIYEVFYSTKYNSPRL